MLVFILAITHAAIRQGREGTAVDDTMTLAELRTALGAIRDVELAMNNMPDTLEKEAQSNPLRTLPATPAKPDTAA